MSVAENNRNSNLVIMLNSIIYFILAYFFVVYISNILSGILAISYGWPVQFYYYGFEVEWSVVDYTRENSFMVFFFGNAVTLLLGYIFVRIYKRKRKYPQKIKLFYLWVYILSITWFFGNVIVGAFFRFGIGVALEDVLNFPFYLKLILAIASAFILLYLGYTSKRHIVTSANTYYHKIDQINVGVYFVYQVLFPAILGLILISLYKIPHLNEYKFKDSFILFCIAFYVIGLFIGVNKVKSMKFKRKKDSFKISYAALILLIVLIIIFRLTLANGIP